MEDAIQPLNPIAITLGSYPGSLVWSHHWGGDYSCLSDCDARIDQARLG